MDFTSFEPYELIVLTKALHCVRFESKEPSATEIVGSPFLGELYATATETLWGKVETRITAHYRAHGWPSVTEDQGRMDTIRFHLTQVSQWHALEETNKLGHIRNLVYPYAVSEETIAELLRFSNDYHVTEATE